MMQGGTYAYTETVEDNSLQVRTWSLARTVKFISIIDIIFMGINLINFTSVPQEEVFNGYEIILIFLVLLPVSGFIGAMKYNKILLGFYIFFNVLEILSNIYQASNAYKFNNGTSLILLNILATLIDLWIIELVIKLIKNIRMLSNDQMNIISNNWQPNQNTVWVFY